MIAQLKGTLIELRSEWVVIDTQGVGYKVQIADGHLAKMPQIGEAILLHTTLVVRELSHALYGFLEPSERDLFEQLISLNGIGPKLGLCVIGHLPMQAMQKAVLQKDYKALTKVPGLGKKKAERLLIEMRDKLASWIPCDPSQYAVPVPSDTESQLLHDALGALVNLGYTQNAAKKALKQTLNVTNKDYPLADLITAALKLL